MADSIASHLERSFTSLDAFSSTSISSQQSLSHHKVGQSSFWGAVYVLYKAILDCPVLVAAVFGSETW